MDISTATEAFYLFFLAQTYVDLFTAIGIKAKGTSLLACYLHVPTWVLSNVMGDSVQELSTEAVDGNDVSHALPAEASNAGSDVSHTDIHPNTYMASIYEAAHRPRDPKLTW